MFLHKETKNFWKLGRTVKMLEELLPAHLRENAFLMGGCFKSIFTDTKPKDYDIFFRDRHTFEALSEFYKDNILYTGKNSTGIEFEYHGTTYKIDLVHSVFGSVEDILRKFDFTIAKFAVSFTPIDIPLTEALSDKDYDTHTPYLTYHQDAFEHLMQKKLVIDAELPFPASTFNRVLRYTARGYTLCSESRITLLKALKELPEDQMSDVENLYKGGFD